MPNKEEEFFETIKVVKRNGSKVGFNEQINTIIKYSVILSW